MDKILKAADDIASVFNVTKEWLEPGRAAVVKILKQLVEEKFTSTNTGSLQFFCCKVDPQCRAFTNNGFCKAESCLYRAAEKQQASA